VGKIVVTPLGRSTIALYTWFAVVVSLVLSAWLSVLGGAANDDGVLYLLTAQGWLDGGWDGARATYAWPFYSIAIAELSRTGWSLEHSAWLIDAVAMAALVAGFVRASAQVCADRVALRFAVLLILTLPALNAQRSEIIRDIPFLACFVWYVERALVYLSAPNWRRLLQATLLLAVGFMFRLEAAVIALALPLHALIGAWRHHPQHYWRVLIPVALLFGLGLVGFTLLTQDPGGTRLEDFAFYLTRMQQFGQSFSAQADTLAAAVLNPVVQNYRKEALAAVIATVFIGKLLKTVTWIHVLVALSHRPGIVSMSSPANLAFCRSVAFLALLSPFFVLLVSGISTGRYLLPAALVLLLCCPPAYVALLARWPRAGLLMLIGLAFLCVAGNAANFTASKSSARAAGAWLGQQSGTVWCNQQALCYYSGRHDLERDRLYPWREWRQRMGSEIQDSEWIAVLLARKEHTLQPELERELGMLPVQEFIGSDGDRVLIFSRLATPKQPPAGE